MRRTILSWVAILVIIGAGGVGYVYWQNTMVATKQNEQSAASKNAAATPSSSVAESAAKQPGVYTEYQEGLVASTDGVKVLFFHAPWCPQCRMIEADIESDGVPDGVTILKVDYDTNQALDRKSVV